MSKASWKYTMAAFASAFYWKHMETAYLDQEFITNRIIRESFSLIWGCENTFVLEHLQGMWIMSCIWAEGGGVKEFAKLRPNSAVIFIIVNQE